MLRWLRRLIWLGIIGGIGAACYTVWQRRQREPSPPTWPPVDQAPLRLVGGDKGAAPATFAEMPVSDSAATDAASETAARGWVPPVDGACPAGYPVKGNASSGIYHVPGGRFYARTVPERCYASAADAEADGYRAAKS
ncbi:MAG: hypothetical protein ACRDZZ_02730 [Ilumatobacteraceae bacterium]